MQYTALLLAAAASVTAGVIPRQESSPTFVISDFYIGGEAHSTTTFYRLTVEKSDGTAGTSCSREGPALTGTPPDILTFPLTACEEEVWSWTFEEASGGGKSLVITYLDSETDYNQTATAVYPQSDIVEVNSGTPTGNYVELEAPESFTLTYEDGPFNG